MKYIKLVILWGLIATCAVNAGEKATPLTPKTALVVQLAGSNDSADVTSRGDSLLGEALLNYSRYYLQARGEQCEPWLIDQKQPFDSLLQILQNQAFTEVVYLSATGEITTRHKIIADHHARQRITSSGGYLDIAAVFRFLSIGNGRWRTILESRVSQRSQTNWSGYADNNIRRRTKTNFAALPEPYEYVIQRAVTKILSQLPPLKAKIHKPQKTIPVRIMLSAFLRKYQHRTIASKASDIVAMASRSMARQFGVGLNVCAIEKLDREIDTSSNLQEGMNWLAGNYPSNGDTLLIFINDQLTYREYFNTRKHENIGLSQLGKNRIIINLLPERNNNDSLWDMVANGLVLLHEIGHSFGAIHVSDINSIMSHEVTWIGSDQFDPVNRLIVKAALSGELTFDDLSTYLTFVSEIIQGSNYYLTDYPEFFYLNLNSGENERFSRKLRTAIGRRSFLLAADAYGYLQHGDKQRAAKLFRMALNNDPYQVSLYYYLSLTAKRSEAKKAKAIANRRGYYRAQNMTPTFNAKPQ